MDTSRRVDIDWWETEGARSSCDTARKSLDNAYQEMKDARSSCKKLSKSLHGVYNDLVSKMSYRYLLTNIRVPTSRM